MIGQLSTKPRENRVGLGLRMGLLSPGLTPRPQAAHCAVPACVVCAHRAEGSLSFSSLPKEKSLLRGRFELIR